MQQALHRGDKRSCPINVDGTTFKNHRNTALLLALLSQNLRRQFRILIMGNKLLSPSVKHKIKANETAT